MNLKINAFPLFFQLPLNGLLFTLSFVNHEVCPWQSKGLKNKEHINSTGLIGKPSPRRVREKYSLYVSIVWRGVRYELLFNLQQNNEVNSDRVHACRQREEKALQVVLNVCLPGSAETRYTRPCWSTTCLMVRPSGAWVKTSQLEAG
jgi:hypothetical protein